MTKIDEAMEKIRARGGIRRNIANEERVGNMSAGELRAILTDVFGAEQEQESPRWDANIITDKMPFTLYGGNDTVPSAIPQDLEHDREQQRIGYDIGYERGIKAEQALSQLALSAVPQDVEATDSKRMRLAGCELAEAASRVVCDYDGVHRLSRAIGHWYDTISSEGGRPYFAVNDRQSQGYNDRRALVKLRDEVLTGWNEDLSDIDNFLIPDSYTVGLRYLLGLIDTLLAKQPEPAFPIAELEAWLDIRKFEQDYIDNGLTVTEVKNKIAELKSTRHTDTRRNCLGPESQRDTR